MTATLSPVGFTFGTDEAVECVLARIAERDVEADAGGLWGRLSQTDAEVWHAALIEAGRGDLLCLVGGGEPYAYVLDAESTGVLFEALSDYALGEPRGKADGERRDAAWGWASDIATHVARVELV